MVQLGIGKAVYAIQFFQRGSHIVLGWGNEFQQGFGIVGRNLRIGQRRA